MKFKELIKKEINETKVLLKSIPTIVVTLFVVSVICMNILANKTLVQLEWIALDGGILISWLSFMCMDIITKHFGPKASNKISILAALINLLTCAIFFIASIIPSNADDYSSLNSILGGTWFILLSSTVAFLLSAVINNLLNHFITRCFNDKYSKRAYVVATYVSTFVGQFLDNLMFSLMVFMLFAPIFWDGFSWSFVQCVMCALTGALLELVMEVIFSPIGYRVLTKWREQNVGRKYLYLIGKDE
jgi:uncharacterized integral membrane protein (TIGR00697 family)